MSLLTEDFLNQYPDMPEHMNQLGLFVFYRTYSRWLPHQGRRETWREAVARAVDYNVNISIQQLKKINFETPVDKIRCEAETLFDNIFNLRQFLSGRTHWIGGAESNVADKFPLANFNCSFIDITKWEDLYDLFYLLLVGVGVGFRCTQENATKLPPIRTDFTLLHSEYKPLPKEERLENTNLNIMDNGYAKIYIGDSKNGWNQALSYFLNLITDKKYEHIKYIKISYNSIRPAGERLLTFGGTASGYEPMKEMFEGFNKVLKNTLETENTLAPLQTHITATEWYNTDESDKAWKKLNEEGIYKQIRPIHILDMGNLIGNNVIVGGVRRTAEIFLFDADDEEVLNAKNNITPNLYHRFMSNNSIAFDEKPTREKLHEIFQLIKQNGEPGFFNLEAARRRRPNVKGLNPCAEILLDSYGVCNLTTVNVKAFVRINEDKNTLDYQGLMQAQALSARAGLRMTCLDLELPHWDIVHKRDRLIGCSLTGWKDAIELLGYNIDQEAQLLSILSDVAHQEAMRYSHTLRIPTPILITTVKPEGTLSQVAGGVSSGVHTSFAPYYIRRIRINAHDPLARLARELDWQINPEVGQALETARTLVIDFPIASPIKSTRVEKSVAEQFDTYFMFQNHYSTHNSSITIYVKDDEWDEAEQIVWDNWNDFVGVSFMPYDGGMYELAPYEEITEEQYALLSSQMKPFEPLSLWIAESEASTTLEEGMESCDGGACPIR